MNWAGYLELAQELAKDPKEAYQRCAISRAYYAALLTVREWLQAYQNVQFNLKEAGTHKAVWDGISRDHGSRLGPGSNVLRKRIQDAGKRLKTFREWADYESSPNSDLAKTVEQSLQDASTVLKCIEDLSKRLSRDDRGSL